jgi:Cu/Ag efflux protein CusF
MTSKKTLSLTCAIALAAGLAATTYGQDQKNNAAPAATKATPAQAADMTNGEVRKVDKDAKKITIRHEAIKNLDMPGMTMVFQVRDASILDRLQSGDKVKFAVIQEGGAYVVTDIQVAK